MFSQETPSLQKVSYSYHSLTINNQGQHLFVTRCFEQRSQLYPDVMGSWVPLINIQLNKRLVRNLEPSHN